MSRGFTTDMLSQGLAVVVGVGSISLYLAAFFFPEVHRRHDFFWSGVGCLYALILWTDATQITPTEFVGHLASVSLLGWMGWQTLTLRRRRTPKVLQTPYTEDSWPTFRREMTDLAQGFLRQSPLGRWLPGEAQSSSGQSSTAGLRVSSLKDVGYEFLDDVDPTDSEIRRGSGVFLSPVSPPSPPPAVPTAPAVRSRPQAAKTSKAPQVSQPSKSAQPSKAPKAMAQSPRLGGQSGRGLLTWVQTRLGSIGKPKPKRAVIDIPPRPPSIPLTKAPKEPSQPQAEQAADSPQAERPPVDSPSLKPSGAGTIAIQDVAAQPLESALDATAAETTAETSAPEPAVRSEPDLSNAPNDDPDTNWPDEETVDGGQNLADAKGSSGDHDSDYGASDNSGDEGEDEDWI